MPAIGAALSAFGAAFGASTVGAFLTTNIIGKLLVTVAISALQTAMMPKPRAAGIKTGVTAAGGTNPCSFVLGRYATAGYAVCPPMSHGADEVENQYLTYVIELGSIAGQGLERLIIDGEYAEIGGTPHPDYGTPVGGRFAGKAWVKYYDGSQTVADPMLIAKYGSYPDRPWSANMIGRGLCYVIATFSYDREVFNGVPKLRFEVSGIPLYDPRKDSTAGGSGAQRWANPATWASSDNPLVQVYNILRGISFADGTLWGGDAVAADLPADAWFAAMNACDVAVAISGGGTEPRWRTGFEVTVDEEPVTIIEELLKGCSGQLVDIGGLWKPRVGGPGLPVYFLDDDGIIINQPQDFDPFPPLDQCFNGIQASYPEPDSLWEAKDAPPRYSEVLEAEDGGRRLVADLNLPAVPYKRQVQRVMKAYIKDERRMRRHDLTLPPAAALIEPLDAIAWTSARNGYAAKVFEVSQVQEAPDTLLQTLSIKERNPADYDWEAADELPSSITAGKIVAAVAQPVPGWSVLAHTVYDAAGNPRKPALRLVWSANKLKAAVGLEWQIRLAGGGTVVRRGSTQSVEDGDAVVTGGILPNTAYQARARAIMRRPRAWSAWVGATTPNLRTAKADLADDVTDYMAETATLAGIKPVSTLPAAGDKIDQIVMKVPEGVLYRWDGTSWTRTLFGGIKPGDVDVASFAAGLAPVGLVTSGPLPTVKTTDVIAYGGKLYRWSGTDYVASVPAIDVTGQMTNAQIADLEAAKLIGKVVEDQIADAAISISKFATGVNPVELVTALPTTDHVQGRTVFLTADNKLYRNTGTGWTTTVTSTDVDGRGLDILDPLGNKVFGSDGTIGSGVTVNVNGSNILLTAIAANSVVPSLNYIGAFSTAPTQVQLGEKWVQNAVYKNTTDAKSYVLTGSPLAWAEYLSDGMQFSLQVESTNGTIFRVGQSTTTTLIARVFKNGAEVTDVTPASWFRWRRVSILNLDPPHNDATFNASYSTGYKQVSINIDTVNARATFFCDIISPS